MPTKQQLESALRNADAAGDFQAAKQLANALKRGEFNQQQTAQAAQVPPMLARVPDQDSPAIQRPIDPYFGSDIFEGLPDDVAEGIRSRFPIPAEFEIDTGKPTLGPSGETFYPYQTMREMRKKHADIERARIKNPQWFEEINNMTPSERDKVAIGHSVSKFGRGIKRLTGNATPEDVAQWQEEEKYHDVFKSVRPGAAVTEGLFDALGVGVGGLSTAAIRQTVPRIAANAALGSAEGGLPSLGVGESGFEAVKKAAIGAGLNVAAGELFTSNAMSPAKEKIKKLIEDDPQSRQIAKYYVDGAGRVRTDKLASDAISQGFDDGVVAVAKGASKTDKTKMQAMLNIIEKGKKNALFSAQNRPSDVVGDSLSQRVRYVEQVNKQAATQLDDVAKSLKGKRANYGTAVDDFINDLDSIGVTLDDGLKPNFAGSDIEDVAGAQNIINRVVQRMKKNPPPDAYDVHRMKRFIDEQVTYGKNAEGLAGKSETIIKKLRRNLDKSLDDAFPVYNDVNTRYADTIGVLDDYQKAVGRSIDFNSDNLEKSLGTVSRRLLSNAQTRVTQLDAMTELENIGKKYGAKFDDDITTQVLFVDELDRVFSPAAKTSLQGDVSKVMERGVRASQQGIVKNLVDAAEVASKKVRGVTDEKALKAMRELLTSK
jgi:hypothetical protein